MLGNISATSAPKIVIEQSRIRRLSETTINRIAAGEVVERPASAVKELVENAIDCIDITISDGGKSLIAVKDNGCGMGPEDLALAVERHATSKLARNADGNDDLVNITALGFRGEALPAIGAVSRMRIVTRGVGGEAWEIRIEGGRKGVFAPVAHDFGSLVEVRDLFFATPARAKFLKTAQAETTAVCEVVRRQAIAHPEIAFTLTSDGRSLLRLTARDASGDALLKRLSDIMGQAFAENSVPFTAEREGHRVSGYAGLPTMNRATAQMQFVFVNGRPVRDRLLIGAVRGAYAEYLARDRHPALMLAIEVPPALVDVNVHPAKTEVRFQDSGLIRGLIVSGLKHALREAGHRASTTVALTAMRMFAPSAYSQTDKNYNLGFAERSATAISNQFLQPEHDGGVPNAIVELPLGLARAQFHDTYIFAQTSDGIVIIDQHAAHERLVLETMKRSIAAGRIERQVLLVPEIVELDFGAADRIIARAHELRELGLHLEAFGEASVLVREVPALLGDSDLQGLIRDLSDELMDFDAAFGLKERLDSICGTMACHSSVRAGRQLNVEEMNAILRQMEATPHSGQCNHGRPTYVELHLNDIERLFGRR